jgi:hypothetical protein
LSRGGRDDDRSEVVDRAPERRTAARAPTRREDIAARDLPLPHGEERELVEFCCRAYSLNGAEARILATVGAFRVLPPDELTSGQDGQHSSRNECRHLIEQGLLAWEPIAPRHIPGLPACVSTFRQFAASVPQSRPLEETDQLQTYFTTLDLVEQDDLKHVTVEKLNRFRDLRRRFAAPEFEMLFQRWNVEGPVALADRYTRGFLSALDERRGEPVRHQLPIRCDRFGTRAGVS